ncbi:MAG: hypothetical protein ACK55Z_23695, partial [bacterium]
VDLHPGSRCVLHLPISKPLSLAILYLEPRRLGGHPVGDLLADVVALIHRPLHRSHRHLKQCSPEGSHEPPPAASHLGDCHRPDHDVQQHPHDT